MMELNEKAISGMKHHLDACRKYLTALEQGYRSPEKRNTLLDAAMQQVELCCIDMRLLCEKARANRIYPLVEKGKYKKHFVYLNEWTIYTVEDVSGAYVDNYHYEVNYLPEMIMPVTLTMKD